VDLRDVQAYAQRPWATVEASKRDHWASEFARRGPEASFQASQALWVHMRALRPDWPSVEERRADLAHHVEFKRAIDRAAGIFVADAGR
jgi:hypothetical protein